VEPCIGRDVTVAAILCHLLIAQHGPAHKANLTGAVSHCHRQSDPHVTPAPARSPLPSRRLCRRSGVRECAFASIRKLIPPRATAEPPAWDVSAHTRLGHSSPVFAGGASSVGSADSLSISYGSCQMRSPVESAKYSRLWLSFVGSPS